MPTSPAGNSGPERDSGFAPGWRSTEHGFTAERRFAEHGFTSMRRFAEHGFTLVELMVVIAIIGVASAAVAFALPDPRGRVRDEAARFAGRVRAAHDLAITAAHPVSVWVEPGGYGFDQRVARAWLPMADKPLRVEHWSRGTAAIVCEVGGRERVVFDETGLADRPLDVELVRDAVRTRVRIAGDGTVRVD